MLVCLTVFKTARRELITSRVGSIPTYSRQYAFFKTADAVHDVMPYQQLKREVTDVQDSKKKSSEADGDSA